MSITFTVMMALWVFVQPHQIIYIKYWNCVYKLYIYKAINTVYMWAVLILIYKNNIWGWGTYNNNLYALCLDPFKLRGPTREDSYFEGRKNRNSPEVKQVSSTLPFLTAGCRRKEAKASTTVVHPLPCQLSMFKRSQMHSPKI